MTALRSLLYGGRRLSAGETFEATRSDARVLRGIKKAAYRTTAVETTARPGPPSGTLHAPPVPVETPDVSLEPQAPEPEPPDAPDAPIETPAASRRRASKGPRATRARTYQTREIVAETAETPAEDESA